MSTTRNKLRKHQCPRKEREKKGRKGMERKKRKANEIIESERHGKSRKRKGKERKRN